MMVRLCLFCLLGFLLVACGSDPAPAPTATVAAATAVPTDTPRPTDIPTPLPATTTPSVPTATPAPLSEAELLAKVKEALVVIETPLGTGLGVLIDGGYIITNIRLIWPIEVATATLSDGTEERVFAVPVKDYIADLVVLGPVETSLDPITIADFDEAIIGEEAFSVTYRYDNAEEMPEVVVTAGVVQEIQNWAQPILRYLQTDMTLSEEREGGLLLSSQGEVVGLTHYPLAEGGNAFLAAQDALLRIDRLIAGEDINDMLERRLPIARGTEEYLFVVLSHEWDVQTYYMYPGAGRVGNEANLQVKSGETNVAFDVVDVLGKVVLSVDESFTGVESGSYADDLPAAPPYYVQVFQTDSEPRSFDITTDRLLWLFVDHDDNLSVGVNNVYNGGIDYPGDLDHFLLVLERDEVVHIQVESMLIDPSIKIVQPGYDEAQIVQDDNSGGGIRGWNAELTFQAPSSGVYYLVIEDSAMRVGGYAVHLSEPTETSPPAVLPKATPMLIGSPFGPMQTYSSPSGQFEVQYPAAWRDTIPQVALPALPCDRTTACYFGVDNAMVINEVDVSGQSDTDFYGVVLAAFTEDVAASGYLGHEEIELTNGVRGLIIDFMRPPANVLRGRLLFVQVGSTVFDVTYYADVTETDALLELSDYLFGTLVTP